MASVYEKGAKGRPVSFLSGTTANDDGTYNASFDFDHLVINSPAYKKAFLRFVSDKRSINDEDDDDDASSVTAISDNKKAEVSTSAKKPKGTSPTTQLGVTKKDKKQASTNPMACPDPLNASTKQSTDKKPVKKPIPKQPVRSSSPSPDDNTSSKSVNGQKDKTPSAGAPPVVKSPPASQNQPEKGKSPTNKSRSQPTLQAQSEKGTSLPSDNRTKHPTPTPPSKVKSSSSSQNSSKATAQVQPSKEKSPASTQEHSQTSSKGKPAKEKPPASTQEHPQQHPQPVTKGNPAKDKSTKDKQRKPLSTPESPQPAGKGQDDKGKTKSAPPTQDNPQAAVKAQQDKKKPLSPANEETIEALVTAIEQNNITAVKGALQAVTEINVFRPNKSENALHYAARKGRLEVVNLLLEKGADISIKDGENKTAIGIADDNCFFDISTAIFKHDRFKTAKKNAKKFKLHWACASGDATAVNEALKELSDINCVDKVSYTGLHYACVFGYEGIVRMLLKHSANQSIDNALDINLRTKVRLHGALHLASMCGHSDIVRVLIDGGADPNLKDSLENRPLHYACKYREKRSSDIVQMLIGAGADLNPKNKSEDTPLSTSCKFG